jgi:hypothetical protein
MTFTAIDGIPFDQDNESTPELYLYNLDSPKSVNLTRTGGGNVSINIDYFPLVFGAFEFRSFYTGVFFEKVDDHSIRVTRVLNNGTENGINEGILERGDIITNLRAQPVNLSSGVSIEEFITSALLAPITQLTPVDVGIQDGNGTRYIYMNFIPIPKSYVFVGIQSSPYWVPKNSFTRFLGGNFPIWLEKELFYFYTVAFSITLFNMLPLPIFDGNRILRELVHWIVGTKKGKKTQKKIRLYFDPEESDYHLMAYDIDITDILNVEMDLTSYSDPSLIDPINYIPIDTIQDGYYDSIRIKLNSGSLPEAGTPLIATVEYNVDERVKLKKGIILAVGLITTGLILANFILSYLLLGNITFWV